ncbi:MAG: cadherin-like beta sandwich domain-containing protein, partial [Fulvivirga sp.]
MMTTSILIRLIGLSVLVGILFSTNSCVDEPLEDKSGAALIKEIDIIVNDEILVIGTEVDTLNNYYYAHVDRSVSEVLISIITVSPEAISLVDGEQMLENNLASLDLGPNEFSIHVSEENGLSRNYTLIIIRETLGVKRLSNLEFSHSVLRPTFHPDTLKYELVCENEISNLSFSYETQDSLSTSISMFNGTVSTTNLTLPKGISNLDIEITADDQTRTTYHVEITRNPWEYVSSGPFNARDGAGVLFFNDKLWLLGGWQDGFPEFDGLAEGNDVWSSSDGVNWEFVNRAPWSGRHAGGYVVFDNKMWVMS